MEIIDATCPVVAALQRKVKRAYEEMAKVGGTVVILGKRGHAEVVGLTGQVDEKAVVVENEAEATTTADDVSDTTKVEDTTTAADVTTATEAKTEATTTVVTTVPTTSRPIMIVTSEKATTTKRTAKPTSAP